MLAGSGRRCFREGRMAWITLRVIRSVPERKREETRARVLLGPVVHAEQLCVGAAGDAVGCERSGRRVALVARVVRHARADNLCGECGWNTERAVDRPARRKSLRSGSAQIVRAVEIPIACLTTLNRCSAPLTALFTGKCTGSVTHQTKPSFVMRNKDRRAAPTRWQRASSSVPAGACLATARWTPMSELCSSLFHASLDR